MSRAIFIRHGESTANAGFRSSLPEDIPLTKTGWMQAEVLAKRFEVAPALIVTSPYLRTQQTAEPTKRRFPSVPTEIWPIHEFTYLDPLHCHNTTGEDRRPAVTAYWDRCDPLYADGDTAESFLALVDRATTLLNRLSIEHGTIALFSHGQFINMVLWLVENRSYVPDSQGMRDWRMWSLAHPVPNTALIQVKIPESIPE